MEQPDLPLFVYDGDCGFCTTSAKWLERHLPPGSPVTVAPFQRLDLRSIGITPAEATDAAWFVEPDGRRRRGDAAIAAMLRADGGGWALLGRVIDFPLVAPLARLVYAVVARFRHRLPGGTDACRID